MNLVKLSGRELKNAGSIGAVGDNETTRLLIDVPRKLDGSDIDEWICAIHVQMPNESMHEELIALTKNDIDCYYTFELTSSLTAQEGAFLYKLEFVHQDGRILNTENGRFSITSSVNAAGAVAEHVQPDVITQLVQTQSAHETRIAALEAGGGGGTGGDGLSAYEVAVNNGFVGTELEWLDSLKGTPGAPGTPGTDATTPHIDVATGNWFVGDIDTGIHAQGPQGNQGEPGPQGSPGANGTDGANGVTPHIDEATGNWFIGTTDTGIHAQGVQGIQGPQGNPGSNGADGAQGPQGEPGIGIVAGGTAGQVLSKKSATDYDTEWITPNAAGGSTYPRGTSFPTSPTSGDAFYRTDRKILYIYEGWWQPIESYGDIALYLSASGSDTNGGFASGDAVKTLEKVWSCIPRLYGGNVTVYVNGMIDIAVTVLSLGGKYAVSGFYSITFVGADGTILKDTFVGTIDESIAGNDGLISGLSGMTASAYRGKLLKNVTNGWYSVIFDNATNNIRTVGKLVKPLNGSYSPSRLMAATDTWKVMEFGGGFNFTQNISAELQITSDNVVFKNLFFNNSLNCAAVAFSNCSGRFLSCSSYSAGNLAYGFKAINKAIVVFTDVMQIGNAAALLVDSGSSGTLEGVGAYNTYSYGIMLQALTTNALVDAFRLSQPTVRGTGLFVRHSSQLLLYTSAVPANCSITNFITGLNIGLFSQTNGVVGKTVFVGCTTNTTIDATTANGIAG